MILGAGASFDSVPQNPSSDAATWRPPLTVGLFGAKAEFARVASIFPESIPVIRHLQEVAEANEPIEPALERLQERARSYPRLFTQLTALRFYIQQVIWDCGEHWLETANLNTNYYALADRIEEWRYEQEREVAYVTFNYDLLLEAGLPDLDLPRLPMYGRSQVEHMDSYIASDDTRVIKVHGSVNWGRMVTHDPLGFGGYGGDQRVEIVRRAHQLKISDDHFVVLKAPSEPTDGRRLLFPALAIPTVSKSVYECPRPHVQALTNCLRRVDRILVVGWRAQESHFLEDLQRHLPREREIPVHVVTREGSDGRAIQNSYLQLVLRGLSLKAHVYPHGFTGYLKKRSRLDALLRP